MNESKIEKCFNQEIKERNLNSEKLSKYIAPFDCKDTILITYSKTSGKVSAISFTTVIGAPVEI